MEQTFYIAYFNDGSDVTNLCFVNGYTHADESFSTIVNAFAKRYFSLETPTTIRKYEDISIFQPKIKSDYSFPSGLIFAKSKHEACVYEKTIFPGRTYNSYAVKYLGKIGVLAASQIIPEYQSQLLDSLKSQIQQKDQLIAQQDLLIRRQEAEISRLDSKTSNFVYQIECGIPLDIPSVIPEAPEAPKPLEIMKKIKENSLMAPFMDELIQAVNNKTLKKREKDKICDNELDALLSEIDAVILSKNF
jgi:hypothetical protein